MGRTGFEQGEGAPGDRRAGDAASAAGDAPTGGEGCESDAQLCSRLGAECGSLTAEDDCGRTRTVQSCGTCQPPDTCGGGGPNQCGTGATWQTLGGAASEDSSQTTMQGSAAGGGASQTGGNVYAPAITLDASGHPWIAWSEYLLDGPNWTHVRAWNGSAWLGLAGSAEPGGLGSYETHGADIAGTNTIAVVWTDVEAARLSLTVWTGSAWDELGGSASGGGIGDANSHSPRVAMAPGDLPVVVWTQDVTGGSHVYLKTWTGSQWQELGGSASGGGVSDSSGYCSDTDVAVDANGFPTVVWRSYTGSIGFRPIYLKRWSGSSWEELDASASDLGVSQTSAGGQHPAVALVEDRPIVAWEDWTQSDTAIYLRAWSGSAWEELDGSASGAGVSNSPDNANEPALTTTADGRPVVAWEDYRPSSGSQIFLREWTGSTWTGLGGSDSGTGLSNSNSLCNRPDIVMSPTGPVVAWRDAASTGSAQAYVRHWSGSEWLEYGAGALPPSLSQSTTFSKEPDIALTPTGDPVVAWEEWDSNNDKQIYLRQWSGNDWLELDGSASGGGLSASSLEGNTPALVINPLGSLYASWADGHINGSPPAEIYLAHWDSSTWVDLAGSNSGGGVSASPNRAQRPALAAGPNGRPMVAWHDNRSGQYEILLCQWDGAAWAALGTSMDDDGLSKTGAWSREPTVVVDPTTGYPTVAWTEDRSVIYVRQWNGSNWIELDGSASVGLGSDIDGYDTAALAWVAGVPWVAWTEVADGFSQIYLMRWNGSGWEEVDGSASNGGLSNSPAGARAADMTSDASDHVWVAWQDAAGFASDIYLRRHDGSGWTEVAGSASGGGISNSTAPSQDPTIATKAGRVCIAWTEGIGTVTDVQIRCVDP